MKRSGGVMSAPDNTTRLRKKKDTAKKVPLEKISKQKRREIKRQVSTQSIQWARVVVKRFNPLICACAMTIFCVLVAVTLLFGMWISNCNPVNVAGPFVNPNGWTNVFAINNTLWNAQKMFNEQIPPPQCVSIDETSENIYFGSYGGFISNLKLNRTDYQMRHRLVSRGPVQEAMHPFSTTPLGFPVALQTYGILNFTFVLDQHYGLYTVHHSGKRYQFVPLNNESLSFIHAPMDMTHPQFRAELYIVDMSTKWHSDQLMNQILEGTCTGRLIHYNIGTFKTKVLLNDLCAPVGVEFLNNDNFLAIAEAGRSRIRIVEMNTTSTNKFIKLPGMPHRLSRGQREDVWITMTAVNENFFKTVGPRPWLRKLLTGLLPDDYIYKMATVKHTVIAELGPDLNILTSLHDFGNRKVENVKEVVETEDERLIFSSDTANYLTIL